MKSKVKQDPAKYKTDLPVWKQTKQKANKSLLKADLQPMQRPKLEGNEQLEQKMGSAGKDAGEKKTAKSGPAGSETTGFGTAKLRTAGSGKIE